MNIRKRVSGQSRYSSYGLQSTPAGGREEPEVAEDGTHVPLGVYPN